MSTKTDARVSEWARANNVGLAYTPHHASWLNEVQFTALLPLLSRRHGPREPRGPAFLIRRYIAWRNRHAQDRMLREVVKRAEVA